MSSIHVAIPTNATNSAPSTSGNPTDIAGLQKKLTGLMKELEKASKDMNPGAKERIKLLQVQIQECEMQIQQLQAAAAQKALLKNSAGSHHEQKSIGVKDNTSLLGSKIDTKA